MRRSRSTQLPRMLLTLSLLTLPAARADADVACPAHPAGIQQATKLATVWFQKGKSHIAAGKHREALASFVCAHRFVASLKTRYWIGRCAEALGMRRVALAAYRAVYMNPPKGVNAAELIVRIRNLAGLVPSPGTVPRRTPRVARVVPPEPGPAPPPPPKVAKRVSRAPRHPPYLTPVEGGPVLQYLWRWFDIAPDTSSTGPNPYYRWRTGIPGSAGLWAQIFPGAFFTNHIVGANLGVGIWWARSFPFFSYVRRGGDRDYDTVYQQMDLYFTYRWNILRRLTSPNVKLDLGIGNFKYGFAVPGNVDQTIRDRVKSAGVSYWYFKFRLGAKVPILANRLWVKGQLGFMFPFSEGPVGDWWAYGEASSWGLDTRLDVEARLFWRLYGMAYCQYTGFWMKFKGSDRTFVANKARDHYAIWGIGVHVKY